MFKSFKRKIDIAKLTKIKQNDLKKLIIANESYYHNQIKEITTAITHKKSKIKLLLVSGPSSAGKTTTSNIIKKELEKNNFSAVIISLDDFFVDRFNTPKLPDGTYDFENISSLDLPLLNNFIDDLLRFHKAKMPIYNFFTGKRESVWKNVKIDDHTILIIEGLHALNPKLIKAHKKEIYKVYLNLNGCFMLNKSTLLTAKQVRLIRRITRDYYTRGYSALETLTNWKNVAEGENKWIKPFKKTANYIIDSLYDYELLLYSKYTKPILKELILEDNVKELINNRPLEQKNLMLNNLYLAKTLYKNLDYFIGINKDLVPENSLLLEFVGNAENTVEPLGEIFS